MSLLELFARYHTAKFYEAGRDGAKIVDVNDFSREQLAEEVKYFSVGYGSVVYFAFICEE